MSPADDGRSGLSGYFGDRVDALVAALVLLVVQQMVASMSRFSGGPQLSRVDADRPLRRTKSHSWRERDAFCPRYSKD